MDFIPSVKMIPILSEEHLRGDSECQKQSDQPHVMLNDTAINGDLCFHWWNNSVHFLICRFWDSGTVRNWTIRSGTRATKALTISPSSTGQLPPRRTSDTPLELIYARTNDG